MAKTTTPKIDLRFNDIREAVIEISKTLRDCPLTNDAVAVLIANSSKGGISKTQAIAVLENMSKLEKHYLKVK